MIHLTSDLHMFHDRAFIYGPRGFKLVQTMMDYYKQEWLGNVAKQDDIYIVGDFCLGIDYDAIEQLVKSLPGNKHLLIGSSMKTFRICTMFLWMPIITKLSR